MPRTPITGLPVEWREATGHDDVLLVEGPADLATAVRVLARRADFGAGGDKAKGADVRSLPVGDVDALIVAMRVEALGDRLIAEGACSGCSAAVDVGFSLAAYLEHNRPRRTRLAQPGEPGWWRLTRHDLTFRIPSAGDVLDAGSGPGPGPPCWPPVSAATCGRRRSARRNAPWPASRRYYARRCGASARSAARRRTWMSTRAGSRSLSSVSWAGGARRRRTSSRRPTTGPSRPPWTCRAGRRAAYAERVRIARAATAPLEVAGG